MDEMKFEAWELADFNLKKGEQIKLDSKFGLIKIYRSDDGLLVLVGDPNYGILDQENPSPMRISRTDALLGFVLDIGLQKKKMLTYGHGYYFGSEMVPVQSQREVGQEDYDPILLELIGNKIDTYFQSEDKQKTTEAMRLQHLFDTYNNARLLYPNFASESYLALMRIIDGLSASTPGDGAVAFALFAAKISSSRNDEVYRKIQDAAVLKVRIAIAEQIYKDAESKAKPKDKDSMIFLSESGRFVFACFYSAYQYRNKFTHVGFPFPDAVKEAFGIKEDLGTAYINLSLGVSNIKTHRPNGLEEGDLVDIHEVVGDEAEKFKKQFFLLLPTWHFVKIIARDALIKKVSLL